MRIIWSDAHKAGTLTARPKSHGWFGNEGDACVGMLCIYGCVCMAYIRVYMAYIRGTYLDREAEITQFGNEECLIHKHVLGLDVPVHYCRRMRVQKCQPCVQFYIYVFVLMDMAVYIGVPLGVH